MESKTDPLIAECQAFMFAATALAGMISLRLESLNPKGLKEKMLPLPVAILIDRLRTVNMEVIGVRAAVRTLHYDFSAGQLGNVGRGSPGAATGGETGAAGESPQGTGQPEHLDTGL